MTSPAITAAAASTRTEREVRTARSPNMLQTIQRGASETLAVQRRARTLPCPCCGTDAPLASRDLLRKTYFVQCEWEGCSKPFYAEGETLAEVWANWNARL